MSNFKDFLMTDLQTFINPNEFAEEVIIEGVLTSVVMDDDALKEHQLKSSNEDLIHSEVLFHVKKADLDFEPYLGYSIEFNQEKYEVTDLKENNGIYTVMLGRYTA